MIKIELLRLIYSVNVPENEKSIYKYNLHLLTNFKNICCTCSSKESIELCNITALDRRGNPYLKYPKLFELHDKLFQCVPSNLHNSLIDILVTLRCFMKLKYNTDLNDICNKFQNISQEIQLL